MLLKPVLQIFPSSAQPLITYKVVQIRLRRIDNVKLLPEAIFESVSKGLHHLIIDSPASRIAKAFGRDFAVCNSLCHHTDCSFHFLSFE